MEKFDDHMALLLENHVVGSRMIATVLLMALFNHTKLSYLLFYPHLTHTAAACLRPVYRACDEIYRLRHRRHAIAFKLHRYLHIVACCLQ